jgi:hypothetical protein
VGPAGRRKPPLTSAGPRLIFLSRAAWPTAVTASEITPKIAATPVGTGGSGPLLPLPPSRAPAHGRVVKHPVRQDPLVRFLGVAAFLTVPVTLSLLGAAGATHDEVHALAGYSPERLVHGAVWTVPLSALLLPNVRMLGPTTVFTIAFLVPYALIRGPIRAIVVFFAGHVVAILTVAVVAIGGHALDWATVAPLYRRADLGAAAGLAAVVGGLAGALLTRSRTAGILVLAGVAGFFLILLARSPGVIRDGAEVQQLLALGVGLLVERRWDRAGQGA